MAGYLVAEEGPLAGLVIHFEGGQEWILGRDPDESTIVLEDPRVSRKHAICHLTPEGFLLENLSSVNPSTQNGKVVTEPVLLQEGDILQIGGTYFQFTEKDPGMHIEEEPALQEPQAQEPTQEESEEEEEEDESLSSITFDIPKPSRWLLKVISGPNTGAEFDLYPGSSYVIGRDTDSSNVIFHDLSVSRQHARLSVDEEERVFIEDLHTRNGVVVNGELITEKKELSSQDLIALGTTSFLVIDRKQIQETIISPPSLPAFKPQEPEKIEEPALVAEKKEQEEPKNWKDLVIPTKHLVFAGVFGIVLLVMVSATFSLFKAEPVVIETPHEGSQLKKALEAFPSIQFSYNEAAGKLFLIGHVLTAVDKQELSYTLSNFPFIKSIEDTVVIDEFVWQNMNALLLSNPDWQAIAIYSPSAGKFVVKGYVQTLEQAQNLSEYLNSNFPYPNLLDNQVVIGNNLTLQVQSLLLENGFTSVVFNLANGELVLSGRIDDHRLDDFKTLMKVFQTLPGIRVVQNFVVYSTGDSSRIDISSQYRVTGFSTGSNNEQFVVINQKIFATGDFLNGMQITEILPNMILLEKDGIKFRINYNLQ